jgi:hypothetical protein
MSENSPGRAAYEAHAFAGEVDWGDLADDEREMWEGIARAAIKAHLGTYPQAEQDHAEFTGWMEAQGYNPDPDMVCGGGDMADAFAAGMQAARELAAAQAQAAPELATAERERDQLREQLAAIRERLENLAGTLELSASATSPSKKSQIESGCAEAMRMVAERPF